MTKKMIMKCVLLCLFFIAYTALAEGAEPVRPQFPDVFQVEVLGILRDERAELDGSLYYDKINNRAALSYTLQNEQILNIYHFNDDQLMTIKGVECSVSEIPEFNSFFMYTIDETSKNKTVKSAEDLFYFTNSVFYEEENSLFPSYMYKDNINVTQFGQYNCEIMHLFSQGDFDLPMCESHLCKPTLISIILKCPPLDAEDDGIHHTFDFFRFRSTIVDESVFQVPVGIHCQTDFSKTFPEFPSFYSFSYDLIKEQKESDTTGGGVYTTYKKIWHDTKLRLIRIDEFDNQGLLQASRILDFYGRVAYTIVANIPVCQPGSLNEDFEFNEMTLLPKIFFAKKKEDRNSAVHIGKRSVHGMDYDVWTQSYVDDNSDTKFVQEFYFTNNVPENQQSENNYMQISHVDIYAYQKDDNTGKYELGLMTYVSISNFRSKPKEWDAFDVSSCFEANQKKGFRLKVEGPPTVKSSSVYEEVLEKLYLQLITETNISVIRINQLKGKFDGIYLTEFTGWILDKIPVDGSIVNNKEPDMKEAFNLIEKAATIGKFIIVVVRDGEEKIYYVTSMTNIIPEINPPRPTFPDVFQVEVQAIFHDEKSEADATLFYDRPNNRGVLSYTYQNETTISIYDFNDNQLVYIDGIDCSVSEIDDNSATIFPFKLDKATKKKTIAPPADLFFFTKSEFDRQELSVFPSYIFTATLSIPQYKMDNCTITHVFSKPEVELPDCEGHSCKPTLSSIFVKCPPPTNEDDEVFYTFNFFRFRSGIKDVSVFQPPVGVHCDLVESKPFPDFPKYYSFSYDITEGKQSSEGFAETKQYKIWHDTRLRIVRVDEFDDQGLIEGSRIFDFYGELVYTITAESPNCTAEHLQHDISLDSISQLPPIFFAKSQEDKNAAVYIGQRTINGIDYEAWTISFEDPLDGAKIVQEFYFTQHIPKGQPPEKKYLKISHADVYLYEKEKEENGGNYVLSSVAYLSVRDFRSEPKEWEAFDVSSCFEENQKKMFRFKVEGPPMIKKSYLYESVLQKLYIKLIIISQASLIRINDLKGNFDGVYVSEFTGWILEKLKVNGSNERENEPGMEEAYKLIQNAATSGNLTIKVSRNQVYKVTNIKEDNVSRPGGSCTSGGILAAIGIVSLLIGIIFGFIGDYAHRSMKEKKRPRTQSTDRLTLEPVNSN